MTGQQPRDALLDVLHQPISSSGLDLEDIEISTAGRKRLVRVLVDKDGGVTLDDIAAATTLVSGVLDDSNALGDNPYTLEVTSPGIDRPLTAPRHWRRNVDRLVKIQLRDGDSFVGRLVEVGDDGVTVDLDGTKRELAYADVAKARVEVEFNRTRTSEQAPHPGRK